jgi:hypothetical protein
MRGEHIPAAPIRHAPKPRSLIVFPASVSRKPSRLRRRTSPNAIVQSTPPARCSPLLSGAGCTSRQWSCRSARMGPARVPLQQRWLASRHYRHAPSGIARGLSESSVLLTATWREADESVDWERDAQAAGAQLPWEWRARDANPGIQRLSPPSATRSCDLVACYVETFTWLAKPTDPQNVQGRKRDGLAPAHDRI